MKTIFEQYEEYGGDTLERVCQSFFKAYNQTLPTFGDNDVCVEHTGVRVRQRAGTLERVVNDVGAFQRAWEFLASSPGDGEDDFCLFLPTLFFLLGKGRNTSILEPGDFFAAVRPHGSSTSCKERKWF